MPSAFSNRRLQAEENSVNKAHGITIQILKALANKKNGKQQNLAWPGKERFGLQGQNLRKCAYRNLMHTGYHVVLFLQIAC